jgi:hypothetical protein
MAKKPATPDVTATTPEDNPWDSQVEIVTEPVAVKQQVQAQVAETIQKNRTETEYDLEGLMIDFPTATELERFVYDQTGFTLNLKGRAQKLKYQVAMDVLNGETVDPKFLTGDNPYIDRADLVPVEDLKPVPARDATLPDESEVQNQFYTPFIPHSDGDYRARGKKVHTVFRKYKNGMISYEVLGPIEPKAIGEKMDKFGKMRPELMSWVDPRTGEQVVVRRDGTLTPQGRNLRAIMQTLRVNNTNHWEMWVNRDFVNLEGGELRNPWDVEAQ